MGFSLPDGELDLDAAVVRRRGREIPLTRLERDLLGFLAERRGQAVSRAEVERAVWSHADGVDSAAVPVAIRRLRRKIELNPGVPEVLVTVYGIAWRLEVGAASTRIVGRRDEAAQVRTLLAGRPAVVTLCGEGGVGKTTIARAVATGDVCWVDLDTAADRQALAAVVGVEDRPGRNLMVALADRLASGRPSLVVLDNCEHLRREARELVNALCGRVAVLATSRVPLAADGELLVRVEPFPPPETDDADAVRLLWAALGERTADPGEDVRELLARLGGNALAIVLAAPLLRVSTARELSHRLPLDVLQVGGPDLPARRRSLRRSMDVTWGLLDEGLRSTALQVLVFRAPFTVAAAERVLAPEAVVGRLAALLEHGLLRRREIGGTRMLLVPPLTRELLAGHGSFDPEVAARHAAWHAERWDERSLREVGTRSSTALPFSATWPDLQAAARWFVAAGDPDRAAMLFAATALARMSGGRSFASGAWETFGGELSPRVGVVVAWAVHLTTFPTPETLETLEAGLQTAIALGDPARIALMRVVTFSASRVLGRQERMLALAGEMRSAPSDDPYVRSRTAAMLAMLHLAAGEAGEARALATEALEHAGPDDCTAVRNATEMLAWAALGDGDLAEAERAAERALAVDPEGTTPGHRGAMTGLLAEAVRDREGSETLALMREAARLHAAGGSEPETRWLVEVDVVGLELENGAIDEATAQLRRIAGLARENGWPRVLGAAEGLRAAVLRLAGDPEADRVEAAAEQALADGYPRRLAELWLTQARIFRAHDAFDAARAALDRFDALSRGCTRGSRLVAGRIRRRIEMRE